LLNSVMNSGTPWTTQIPRVTSQETTSWPERELVLSLGDTVSGAYFTSQPTGLSMVDSAEGKTRFRALRAKPAEGRMPKHGF
jgi:hypothetical protein